MSHNDPDDEDWYDDDDDSDGETGRCPECGGPVYRVSDCCPACGYWLTEADREALWSGMAKSTWLKVVAVIVLLALIAGTLMGML
jgi:hypothetical protein